MDAWLPRYWADPEGTSLVVTRSSQIDELIRDGVERGDLRVEEVPAEEAVQSQYGHVRRKQVLIDVRLGRAGQASIRRSRGAWWDRLDWWLQARTQDRSKRAWACVGRRCGRWAFWLLMADLLVLQLLWERVLPRLARAAGRMLGRRR